MHILIAEDDNVSRALLQHMLSTIGHTVTSTSDGYALLQKFMLNPASYDMVFTDVMMPNMNGLEAAREIKKIRKIDVVAVTACDDQTRVCDVNGTYVPWSVCNYFLKKPISIDSIRIIVDDSEYNNTHKK